MSLVFKIGTGAKHFIFFVLRWLGQHLFNLQSKNKRRKCKSQQRITRTYRFVSRGSRTSLLHILSHYVSSFTNKELNCYVSHQIRD